MADKLSILQSLSDDTRFKIIELLINGERCVCEIFPKMNRTQSTVSIHLGKLENAGILQSRRDGKKIFYKIIDKRVIEILKVLKKGGSKWKLRF